jgi:hypothetical protein
MPHRTPAEISSSWTFQDDSIAGGWWMCLPGVLTDGLELRIDDVPVRGIEKVE